MTEPSTEQPDPRTIARPEPHKSGGEQDRLGPFDDTFRPDEPAPRAAGSAHKIKTSLSPTNR